MCEMNVTTNLTRLAAVAAMLFVLNGTQAYAQAMIDEGAQNITTPLGGTTTAANFSFNTFDSTLGTLTSVEIVLDNVTLSGTATGTNNSNVDVPPFESGGPEDIYVNLVGTLTVTTSAGGANDVLSARDSANNGTTNVAVGASTGPPTPFVYTNSPSAPPGSNQTISSPSGAYSSPGGSTSITLTVTASHFGVTGESFASAGSSADYISGSYNGGATALGSVDVIYTYTPVPEPAQTAVWMLAFGLCLLGSRKLFQNPGGFGMMARI